MDIWWVMVLVIVLSCPVKETRGRGAVIPALVFEFFIVDAGKQRLDNVRNLPIFEEQSFLRQSVLNYFMAMSVSKLTLRLEGERVG